MRTWPAGSPHRLDDGGLLLTASDHDGFCFLVRQGEPEAWAAWRQERTGSEHEVVRVDELMARGTPGNGEYVVRSATPDDLSAIRELGEQVLPETYAAITPDSYPQMLLERYWSDDANGTAMRSATEELLVAESAISGVIGVAHTAPFEPGQVILWRLYVLGRARGLGIGTALLNECVRRCPPGTKTLVTEYVTANTDAAGFYMARGFTPLREESEAWANTTVRLTYVQRAIETPAQ